MRDYTIVQTKCTLHYAVASVSTRAICKDKSQRNGIPPHFSYYSYCHRTNQGLREFMSYDNPSWLLIQLQKIIIINGLLNRMSFYLFFFSYKNLYIPDDSSHYTRLIIKCMTLEFVSVIIILVFKMFGIKKKTLIS